jgi:adenosyl cobinamide kinase/adenosyl cobinamide phosphate guanylyltransferase
MELITQQDIETIAGAITNLESERPQQWNTTEALKAVLAKLKRQQSAQWILMDAVTQVLDNYEAKEFQIEDTANNQAIVAEAEKEFYGDAFAGVHLDNAGFIWTTDVIVLDYLINEQKTG